MSYLSQFQLIDFHMMMGPIFLLFKCLMIFDWMLDIVNVALLGAGYFCIPINVHELCAGT